MRGRLPTVISGMSLCHSDEQPTTRRRDLFARIELRLNDRAIVFGAHNPRPQSQGPCHGRRALELNVKVRGHRTRRSRFAALLHDVPGRRPVAMAVEQRATNATVQDPFEGLVVCLGRPFGDNFVPLNDTADPQPLCVGWATPKTLVVRRVGLLK